MKTTFKKKSKPTPNSLNRLRKYFPIIKKFNKLSKGERKKIVHDADKGFIKAICECCLNLQKKRIKLTKKKYLDLLKHTKLIRFLIKKKISLKKKKEALSQTGGGFFIPLLFSVLAPVISNLISNRM